LSSSSISQAPPAVSAERSRQHLLENRGALGPCRSRPAEVAGTRRELGSSSASGSGGTRTFSLVADGEQIVVHAKRVDGPAAGFFAIKLKISFSSRSGASRARTLTLGAALQAFRK
jgi:hypothetical protein